jgi:type I restriction enzyme, S subunit
LSYGKSLVEDKRDSKGTIPVFGSSGQVGFHSKALVDCPTLIVGRKGNVGAVYYSDVPCWVIDTAYYVTNQSSLSLLFFRYLMEFLQLGRLDRSTAVPGLSRSDYDEIEIALAPADEQKRIVFEIEKQFTRLDAAVAALKRAQANLKRYRASVLKAACEGRLVPTEAELARREGRSYESASVLLERILAKRRARWEAGQIAKRILSKKVPKDNGWRAQYQQPSATIPQQTTSKPDGWIWVSLETIADIIDPNPSHRMPASPSMTGTLRFQE